MPIIPDLATTGEQGLPGVEASVWNGFFLPKGTPDPIVRKLNKAMSDTLDDPAIRKRLEELGLEIVPPEHRTPEYLAKYLPEEIERWGKVIQAAGIARTDGPSEGIASIALTCGGVGGHNAPLAPEPQGKDNRRP